MRSTPSWLLLAALLTGPAWADRPADFLARFEAEARAGDASFAASASRGRQWFETRHGEDWSCSTCHTRNPADKGRHEVTGKVIEPMAPAANPERLTNGRNVAKWFRRNCRDVVGRECTAAEKADVVAWLMSVGRN